MTEAERGVKGVAGPLLYECDMISRREDDASWGLGYERLFFEPSAA